MSNVLSSMLTERHRSKPIAVESTQAETVKPLIYATRGELLERELLQHGINAVG